MKMEKKNRWPYVWPAIRSGFVVGRTHSGPPRAAIACTHLHTVRYGAWRRRFARVRNRVCRVTYRARVSLFSIDFFLLSSKLYTIFTTDSVTARRAALGGNLKYARKKTFSKIYERNLKPSGSSASRISYAYLDTRVRRFFFFFLREEERDKGAQLVFK